MTFQTVNYQIQLNVDSFSYVSASPNLTLRSSGGTLSFSGTEGVWLPQPARFSGSYSVDGPFQDLSGTVTCCIEPRCHRVSRTK